MKINFVIIITPVGIDQGIHNSDINTDLVIWNRHTHLAFTFDSFTGFKLPNGAKRPPDASWIAKERREALTLEQKSKFAPICPNFAIQLMSPNDSLKAMQEYEANGARLGQLINRKVCEVEIYRINQPVEILRSPSTIFGEDVLPKFVFDLGLIW